MQKLKTIENYTLERFNLANRSGLIVHDNDLRRWALHASKPLQNGGFIFKASSFWLHKFKRRHRIVSRKINKFVSKTGFNKQAEVLRDGEEFVRNVKPLIESVGASQTFNSDQSGFELELHSGRSLANQGVKQVQYVAQSVSSTTHSYTIQPLISADGRLLSPLFLVLKEPSGHFGTRVQQTLVQPANVLLTASKSGKLTSGRKIKSLLKFF